MEKKQVIMLCGMLFVLTGVLLGVALTSHPQGEAEQHDMLVEAESDMDMPLVDLDIAAGENDAVAERGIETFTIITQDGRELEFNLQIADTQDEQKNGLMHVEHLDDDAGMAFLVDNPHLFVMWMKDTKIPLDMIFINEYGEIEHIHWEAEPMSEKTITNNKPVMAVLELRGGIALDMDINVGDYVLHPHFKNPIKVEE